MADLRWAIDKIDEPGAIGWYIFDTKTDMTICESMVRETLEIILELLAACEATVLLVGQHRGFGKMEIDLAAAVNACQCAIARVAQDD